MEHLSNDECPSTPYWWTHRSLSEEAACLSESPSVEALILACVDAVKAKARGLLVSHVSDAEVLELIALRDRLFVALETADEEAQKDENSPFAKSPVDAKGDTTLRRTVNTVLLRAVISELVLCYNSKTLTTTSIAETTTTTTTTTRPTLDSILDDFLYSVTATHATEWGDDMRVTVWTLLTNVFGMTPLEQEKLLPRLSVYVWDSFLHELHALEEEGKSFAALPSHGERFIAASALVDRAVRVLRMVYVPSAASVSGHVTLPTSAKAKAVVDSLGRWLPGVGECLRVMLPSLKEEGEEKENKEEALDVLQCAPAARDWAPRLQHHVQRLFPVFAQYAETAAWTIPLSNIITHAFHATKPTSTASSALADGAVEVETAAPEELRHEALRVHLVWMSKSSEKSISPGTVAPKSLAEACAMKMGHVLSCAVDRSVPLNLLSVRLLCILLALRPLQTLRHFLTFLCPAASVTAACDCESVITEKDRCKELRERAFEEKPIGDSTLLLTFFPKYFAVFSAVEQALGRLCEDLQGTDAVERFVAAALDEAFSGMEFSGSTATSEWLMFLALLCAEQPAEEKTALPRIRGAACRFFAPRRVMMAYLHRHIVRFERHGLAAFFLPPLRAIGVDYSTAGDAEHVSCALRYPLSAEAAYLQELPRGYYMRQSMRLALNAKNDALHFFHDIFTLPSSAKKQEKKSEVGNTNTMQNSQIVKDSCSSTDPSQNKTSKEDENNIVRALFVDIIAHIGAVVATRNVAVTNTSGIQNHTNTNNNNNKQLQQQQQQQSLHSRHATAPKYDPVAMDVISSVFYGVLRLCRSVTYWDAGRRQQLQRSIVSRLCELTAESQLGCKTNVLGWPLPFLLSEHNSNKSSDRPAEQPPVLEENTSKGMDKEANSDEKVSRTENEEKEKENPESKVSVESSGPHAWLDWFHGAEFEDIDSRAGSCAMALLRARNRDYLKHIPSKTLCACRSMLDRHAAKEKDARLRTVAAIAEAVRLDVNTLRGCHSETDVPSRGAGNGNSNEILVRPLPFTALRGYVESLISALMCRACVSIVDGLTASVALRQWLSAAAGHMESNALIETVRLAAMRVSVRLTQSTTRLECAGLAAFWGDVVDHIAVPYYGSFYPAALALGSEEENAMDHSWIRRALPANERDAIALLRLILDEALRVLRRFLEECTVLGDWKAFVTATSLRHVLGLVMRYDVPFRHTLKNRIGKAGIAMNESTHPLLLLSVMKCPLLPCMTAPVAEVEQLFRQSSAGRQGHPVPVAQQPQGSKELVREKRSRSTEGSHMRRRVKRHR